LSVGFVAQLPSLERQGLSITDALDAFKSQPAVQRLLHGAERLEDGAHIVPEGGLHMRPTLVRDGMMLIGDAAAWRLPAEVIYAGVHYVMRSGIIAADVAHEALSKGDVSAATLAEYPRRLDASYVTRNLRAFQHVPALLTNPHMYSFYPEAVCRIAEE